MNIGEIIGLYGLVPVVVLEDAASAVPVADALEAAGLPVMEVTFRTAAARDSIAAIRKAKPDFILGAGTVLSVAQCEAAVEAGASFIVCPGFDEEIVRWCIAHNICVVPGCVTPGEINRALALGVKTLKFFPADTYGGVKGCKALYAPYASQGVSFIPTGGVGPQNLAEYADKPFIHAVGGGWLADPAEIRKQNFAKITETAREAIDLLLGFSLLHVGVNMPDGESALGAAKQFEKAFGWPVREGNSSVFSSDVIEVMKSAGRGANGHLAIRTNSVSRAIFYLHNRGFDVIEDTVSEKNGRVNFAYLKDEIGGFALHLLQK